MLKLFSNIKCFVDNNKDVLGVLISAISLLIAIRVMYLSLESDNRTTKLIKENKIKERVDKMPLVSINMDFEKKYKITNYTHKVDNKGVFNEVNVYLENTGQEPAFDINVDMYFADNNGDRVIKERTGELQKQWGLNGPKLLRYEVEVANDYEKLQEKTTYTETMYLTYHDTNMETTHHLLSSRSKSVINNLDVSKIFSLYVTNLIKPPLKKSEEINISEFELMNIVIEINYRDIYNEKYTVKQLIKAYPEVKRTHNSSYEINYVNIELILKCTEYTVESNSLNEIKSFNIQKATIKEREY